VPADIVRIPVRLTTGKGFVNITCAVVKQEAQLSQRGRVMPRVVEYFG